MNIKNTILCSLLPKEKYCVQSAAVVSAQLVGDYENVCYAMTKMNDANVKFVSNFNTTNRDFEYELGTEITEYNAFQEGTGCLQGIHVFADEKSAIDYVNTGFTNALRSPVIGSKVYMREATKNNEENLESFRNMISGEIMMFRDEPRHLRKKKLEKIKDHNIFFYDNSIDLNEDKIVYPNVTLPFAVTEGSYDLEMSDTKDANKFIINLKKC